MSFSAAGAAGDGDKAQLQALSVRGGLIAVGIRRYEDTLHRSVPATEWPLMRMSISLLANRATLVF
jgi:hypothetical protein